MKQKNTSAFSLLEIVIAMMIISLVVAGLFGLFMTSHKFIIEAGHRLQAVQYARQVAETLKVSVSADPNTPANAGTDDGHVLDGDGAGGELHENPHTELGIPNITTILTGVTNADCDYTVDEDVVVNAWDVTNGIQINGNTDLEAVTVTVTWREP